MLRQRKVLTSQPAKSFRNILKYGPFSVPKKTSDVGFIRSVGAVLCKLSGNPFSSEPVGNCPGLPKIVQHEPCRNLRITMQDCVDESWLVPHPVQDRSNQVIVFRFESRLNMVKHQHNKGPLKKG